MSDRPGAFSHVGVTVPDLPAAVAWYREVLGLYLVAGPIEVLEDGSPLGDAAAAIYGEGFTRFRFAHLVLPDGVGLELFCFDRPAVRRRDDDFEFWMTGINHFSLTCADARGLAERIAAAGGRVRAEPVTLDAGRGFEIVYCADPWGTVIEVCSHPYAQMWAAG
ncbi:MULTISPECIES: VOC family protein [Pseudonocardia]|uniref:VOC family protein n=1 Tax=Pseudonocardia TaxID=1847 RepID=UPI001CF6D9D3|nr:MULTISPECIES: VOC family protein [unclassified Pseudonocardia]